MLSIFTQGRRIMVTTKPAKIIDLKSRWQELDSDATESIVADNFIRPFLAALGFDLYSEIYPQFPTGRHTASVDFAAGKSHTGKPFISTKENPYLILEVKGKNVNLSQGTAPYKNVVDQLKSYLLDPNCITVKWGIICNSDYIQLFRKHEKVVYPASECRKITQDNIEQIITEFKDKIWKPSPALTVAIYNDKGGVGKTTTTVNIAATLTMLGKKVLVIDFDFQQRDLTTSLGLTSNHQTLFDILKEPKKPIQETLVSLTHIFKSKTGKKESRSFDVIPANQRSISESEIELRKFATVRTLSQIIDPLRTQYHYILIDTPTSKNFFSESALYAAEVVLIPAKRTDFFSLKNAAITISQFIPEIQQQKPERNPIALPILFNAETISEAQKKQADQAIKILIENTKKDKKFDLEPYFSQLNQIPHYAIIGNAHFSFKPAVYIHKTAFEYYRGLVKEYFLQ